MRCPSEWIGIAAYGQAGNEPLGEKVCLLYAQALPKRRISSRFLTRSRFRRAASGFTVLAVLVIAPAAPAWAHSLGPSGSSNYRSTLSSISPYVSGVSVEVLDDGQHIRLSNTAPAPVVILGYSDEPYLMVDAGGVWQNVRAPSLYLNRSSTAGLVYMPPGTDARARPLWQRACKCHAAVWHDHRIHWGSNVPPPAVAAAPGRYHLVEIWQIQAREGETNLTLSGVLSWVPGPSPAPWLGGAGVAAALVLLVGFLRRWRIPLATALLALVAVDAARVAGMIGGHSGSFSTQLHAVPDDGVASLLLWVASLVVVRWARRGRVGAAYGAATIGLILALIGGVTSLSAVWHSQIVTAYPANLQRLLIVATLALGAGLFAAGAILIDRLDKQKVDSAGQAPGHPEAEGSTRQQPTGGVVESVPE